MDFEKLVAFIKAARETATDEVALQAKELYPLFDNIKGTWQKKGFKCRFEVDGVMHLFKLTCEDQTEQGTYIAENYTPTDAAAIWTAIDETHAGTLEDPIPAAAGMAYEYGKYYTEGETIYLCNREGGKEGDVYRLDFLPSALIGHYFEVVE